MIAKVQKPMTRQQPLLAISCHKEATRRLDHKTRRHHRRGINHVACQTLGTGGSTTYRKESKTFDKIKSVQECHGQGKTTHNLFAIQAGDTRTIR